MTRVCPSVPRDTTPTKRTIVCVHAVTSAVSRVLATTVWSAPPVNPDSSSRERAVLSSVQTGWTNKEISRSPHSRTSQSKLLDSLFSHFGNTATMLCESCDPSCNLCVGPGNRNCLSCREDFVFMRQWGQCLRSCPQGFYQDLESKTCHKCHPTCKTCNGTLFSLFQNSQEKKNIKRVLCKNNLQTKITSPS